MQTGVQLISPMWGPLETGQAQQASSRQAATAAAVAHLASSTAVVRIQQVLSDSNSDFLVVGVLSAEASVGAALVDLLAGTTSAAAAARATSSSSKALQGLQLRVRQ